MDIKEILISQQEILLQLRDAVLEEKKALIYDDGKALSLIVEKKIEFMEKLEETEKVRILNFGNCKLEDIDNSEEVQKIGSEIKVIYDEIRNHQEINLMLTQQTIDYQAMLMNVIQSTIKKAGTYGKNAKIEGKQNFKASVDRSV